MYNISTKTTEKAIDIYISRQFSVMILPPQPWWFYLKYYLDHVKCHLGTVTARVILRSNSRRITRSRICYLQVRAGAHRLPSVPRGWTTRCVRYETIFRIARRTAAGGTRAAVFQLSLDGGGWQWCFTTSLVRRVRAHTWWCAR